MLAEKENIVVGVSGGADSMCLLFLLRSVRERMSLNLAVVHVNHHMRETAGRDAEYVRGICSEWGIPCFVYDYDVEAYAKEQHMTTEEAGRVLRYRAFGQTLEEQFGGCGKIAVAHNRNDRAETVLFHLFRGSGLRGLTGINATRDNIIRPILHMDRGEIVEILKENGIAYCEDETNAGEEYSRNRIRNRVIPYVDENICGNVVNHINDAANLIAEAEEYLNGQAAELYGKLVVENVDSVRVDAQLSAESTIMQKYVLRRCIDRMTPNAKDITSAHIAAIHRLLEAGVGKSVDLPYRLVARRDYDAVWIERVTGNREDRGDAQEAEVTIDVTELRQGEELAVSLADRLGAGAELVFTVFCREKGWNVPEKAYTKCFDYDKINRLLTIRGRKIGDYLMIRGREGMVRKNCKDYLINAKVPRADRDSIVYLTEGEHVLWMAGLRISEYYKITENTEKILQVQIRGGAEYGRDS